MGTEVPNGHSRCSPSVGSDGWGDHRMSGRTWVGGHWDVGAKALAGDGRNEKDHASATSEQEGFGKGGDGAKNGFGSAHHEFGPREVKEVSKM